MSQNEFPVGIDLIPEISHVSSKHGSKSGEPPPAADDFADLLVAFDEALRCRLDASTTPPPPTCNPAAEVELIGAQECLLLLEEAWPRSGPVFVAPEQVGRFAVKGVLGQGGFGVVLLAFDPILKRDVALKLSRSAMLLDPRQHERFLREGQVAAGLHHPHIVPVFEAGEADGFSYLTADYCPGLNLAEWLRRVGGVKPATAAQIALCLAQATHYAHQSGVLHRDIKPANIMLDSRSPTGELPFTPKLTDFGLAHLLHGDAKLTATGAVMGTVCYMAPEQAAGRHEIIGPSTDVYALGAVLYEMLTGRPPHQGTNQAETLHRVLTEEPITPCRIVPRLPRDLEAICMKCLERLPALRYRSADDLAADLTRFSKNEPTKARPISQFTFAVRWWAKRPQLALLVVILLAVAVVAPVVAVQQATLAGSEAAARRTAEEETRKATAATQLAEDRARQLARTIFAMEVPRAAEAWKRNDVRTMTGLLQPFSVVGAGEEDVRDFAWHYLWRQQAAKELFCTTFPAAQYVARFSPDGRYVAFAGADSVIRIFSTERFELTQAIPTGQKEVNGILFGPTGQWVASAGDDGTVAKWELGTGLRLARWNFFEGKPAYQLAYSPILDVGIVCGNRPTAYVLDFETGERKHKLADFHTAAIKSVVISPDARKLATCGADSVIGIWDLESGRCEGEVQVNAGYLTSAAWSQDGKCLAVMPNLGNIRFYDVETGKRRSQGQLYETGKSLSTTRDGLLLAGDGGGVVSVFRKWWEPSALEFLPSLARWTLHSDRIYGLDVSPDQSQIATASRDKQVVVVRTQFNEPVTVFKAASRNESVATYRSVVGPDHKGRFYRVTAICIRLFNERIATTSKRLKHKGLFVDLSMRGKLLLATDNKGCLWRWSLDNPLETPDVMEVLPEVAGARLAPLDDRRVYVYGQRKMVLWDLASKAPIAGAPLGENAVVSDDDKLFAISDVNRLALYNSGNLTEIQKAELPLNSIGCLRFSPDGQLLVIGGADRMVRILEVPSLRVKYVLRGHESVLRTFAITPDCRTLASCDDSGCIRLWDLRTGRELFTLYQHTTQFGVLEFTSDSKELWGVDGVGTEHKEYRWSAK